MRFPKAPLTATWIDPATPATSETITATEVADTAARIPPGDWAARAKVSCAGRE